MIHSTRTNKNCASFWLAQALRRCWPGLLLGLILCGSVPTVRAQSAAEPTIPWSSDAKLDIFSSYLFRGLRMHSGGAVQPALHLRYAAEETRSLDLSLWGHLPLNATSFVELNQSLAFNQRYSRAIFSVGHQVYLYSGDDAPLENRAEVWGSMALDTMLNPLFVVSEDYTRYNLQYYEISLSHVFEKTGEGAFCLALFSNFGFVSNGDELYQANGLVQVTSGVGTEVSVGGVTLLPSISYTAAADDNSRNSLWGGVSLSFRL
jgi:hypothetical protein